MPPRQRQRRPAIVPIAQLPDGTGNAPGRRPRYLVEQEPIRVIALQMAPKIGDEYWDEFDFDSPHDAQNVETLMMVCRKIDVPPFTHPDEPTGNTEDGNDDDDFYVIDVPYGERVHKSLLGAPVNPQERSVCSSAGDIGAVDSLHPNKRIETKQIRARMARLQQTHREADIIRRGAHEVVFSKRLEPGIGWMDAAARSRDALSVSHAIRRMQEHNQRRGADAASDTDDSDGPARQENSDNDENHTDDSSASTPSTAAAPAHAPASTAVVARTTSAAPPAVDPFAQVAKKILRHRRKEYRHEYHWMAADSKKHTYEEEGQHRDFYSSDSDSNNDGDGNGENEDADGAMPDAPSSMTAMVASVSLFNARGTDYQQQPQRRKRERKPRGGAKIKAYDQYIPAIKLPEVNPTSSKSTVIVVNDLLPVRSTFIEWDITIHGARITKYHGCRRLTDVSGYMVSRCVYRHESAWNAVTAGMVMKMSNAELRTWLKPYGMAPLFARQTFLHGYFATPDELLYRHLFPTYSVEFSIQRYCNGDVVKWMAFVEDIIDHTLTLHHIVYMPELFGIQAGVVDTYTNYCETLTRLRERLSATRVPPTLNLSPSVFSAFQALCAARRQLQFTGQYDPVAVVRSYVAHIQQCFTMLNPDGEDARTEQSTASRLHRLGFPGYMVVRKQPVPSWREMRAPATTATTATTATEPSEHIPRRAPDLAAFVEPDVLAAIQRNADALNPQFHIPIAYTTPQPSSTAAAVTVAATAPPTSTTSTFDIAMMSTITYRTLQQLYNLCRNDATFTVRTLDAIAPDQMMNAVAAHEEREWVMSALAVSPVIRGNMVVLVHSDRDVATVRPWFSPSVKVASIYSYLPYDIPNSRQTRVVFLWAERIPTHEMLRICTHPSLRASRKHIYVTAYAGQPTWMSVDMWSQVYMHVVDTAQQRLGYWPASHPIYAGFVMLHGQSPHITHVQSAAACEEWMHEMYPRLSEMQFVVPAYSEMYHHYQQQQQQQQRQRHTHVVVPGSGHTGSSGSLREAGMRCALPTSLVDSLLHSSSCFVDTDLPIATVDYSVLVIAHERSKPPRRAFWNVARVTRKHVFVLWYEHAPTIYAQLRESQQRSYYTSVSMQADDMLGEI